MFDVFPLGVLGLRGVDGLGTQTRCLGVTATFFDSASRCRGVCGVEVGVDFLVSFRTSVACLVIAKWELILFGDATMRDWGVPCFAGLDATFGAVALSISSGRGRTKGLQFSSLPSTAIVRRFARVWMPVLPVQREISIPCSTLECMRQDVPVHIGLLVRLPRTEEDITVERNIGRGSRNDNTEREVANVNVQGSCW